MNLLKFNTRKCFVSLVSFILLQSLLFVSYANGISDVEGHWAENEIKQVMQEGWISGYSGNHFGVDTPLSRAEMAVILSKLGTAASSGNITFVDVPDDHWAASSISAAAEAGFMSGYPDQSFAPDGHITREELAVTLFRVFPLTVGDGGNSFTDISTDRWSYAAVDILSSNGLFTGYPDGTFRPTQSVTRAELAVIFHRIFEREGTHDWTLESIKHHLEVGMNQEEVIASFGSAYIEVSPAKAPIPGTVWRYDFGTMDDYRFEEEMDSVDLDGLSNHDLDYQMFITWTEERLLERYTVYYAGVEGIFEYRVYPNGDRETNLIRASQVENDDDTHANTDSLAGYIVFEKDMILLDQVEVITTKDVDQMTGLTLHDPDRIAELNLDIGDMPNGYYIHNPNTETIALHVSPKTEYTFTDVHLLYVDPTNGDRRYTTTKQEEYMEHLNASFIDGSFAGEVPYPVFIEVNGQDVISITEILLFTQ